MSTILITGARGNIGSRVVANLVQRGASVRALVHRPAEARFDPAVEVVPGAYADPSAVAAAMKGVSRALFITAGPELATQDGALAGAAKAAGVEHVVKLSVWGARSDGPEIPAWHRAGEECIEAAGLPWTFLRPGPFASNALRWLPTLRSSGKAFGAFGLTPLPFIHPGDIAEVATRALTEPGHAGKIYELTGPDAITAAQQVALLAEVAGKHFEYVNVPDEAALKGMLDGGMPRVAAEAMLHLVQALRDSPPSPNGVVEKLVGRPAWSVRRWVEENSAAFT